jgi:hypothetical protein
MSLSSVSKPDSAQAFQEPTGLYLWAIEAMLQNCVSYPSEGSGFLHQSGRGPEGSGFTGLYQDRCVQPDPTHPVYMDSRHAMLTRPRTHATGHRLLSARYRTPRRVTSWTVSLLIDHLITVILDDTPDPAHTRRPYCPSSSKPRDDSAAYLVTSTSATLPSICLSGTNALSSAGEMPYQTSSRELLPRIHTTCNSTRWDKL